ncbi:MAG: hypothetical protein R3E01_08395 [Pirellulaceae bacterium]|nr:hypothetical protein [Planctomycetales bacterium]
MADQLQVRDPNTGRTIDWEGEILDDRAATFAIKLSGGLEKSVPRERVVSWSAEWTASFSDGLRAADRHDYDTAISLFREALGQEQRRWVQRRIVAEMAAAYAHNGQIQTAAETILLALNDDPQTELWDRAPLAWRAETADGSWQTRASQLLARDQTPAARLIAASWLLAGRDRASILPVLRELSQSKEVMIASLAQTQLWRVEVVTADANTARRWSEELTRMPPEVRPGGYFLLGQVQARLQDHRGASLTWSRIPMLYAHVVPLAPASAIAAAEQLTQLRQDNDARMLYELVVRDYPKSPEAAEAQQQLNAITKQRTAR